MNLPFNDQAVFYNVHKDAYGSDLKPEQATTLPALFEQVTGFEHGSNQDSVSSGSRLFLPGDHPFCKKSAYRLEGMVAQINVFGGDAGQQYFRVSSVTPVRDTLLSNTTHHVECELRKVEAFA